MCGPSCGADDPESEYDRALWGCGGCEHDLFDVDMLAEALEKIAEYVPEPLHCCPWELIPEDPMFGYMISLHNHYRRGFLPGPGGIGDQSARYVRMMEIIESELGRIEQEYAESQREKQRQLEARQRAQSALHRG